MKLLIALVVFTTSWVAAANAQHGETRQYFRDFLVACRADNYCSATTYVNPSPPSGIVADYILRVGRHQDSLDWEISFTGVAVLPRDDTDIAVIVDGERIDFAFPDQVRAYGSVNDFFFTGFAADTLLGALRDGSRAEVYFRDHSDDLYSADFSLSGLVASMTWIDEQQKRAGLAVRAGPPPVGYEPAFTGVSENYVPDEVWNIRNVSGICDPMEDLQHGRDVRIVPTGGPSAIYIVPCVGGAYNFGYTLTRWDGTYAYQLLFATYYDALGWSGTQVLFNIEIDEETLELTAFEKGRGIGDCGSTGTWVWQGWDFKMQEFTYEGACDATGEPGVFPVIYSADGVGRDGTVATQ